MALNSRKGTGAAVLALWRDEEERPEDQGEQETGAGDEGRATALEGVPLGRHVGEHVASLSPPGWRPWGKAVGSRVPLNVAPRGEGAEE